LKKPLGTPLQMIAAENLLPRSGLKSLRNLALAILKTATMEYGAFAAIRWRDFARLTGNRSFQGFNRIRDDAARLPQVCLTAVFNCTSIVNNGEFSIFSETSQSFRCLEVISCLQVFLVTPFSGPPFSNQESSFDEHITHVLRLS
jgi:hypothetical protein